MVITKPITNVLIKNLRRGLYDNADKHPLCQRKRLTGIDIFQVFTGATVQPMRPESSKLVTTFFSPPCPTLKGEKLC
jgi:hypothetical protein